MDWLACATRRRREISEISASDRTTAPCLCLAGLGRDGREPAQPSPVPRRQCGDISKQECRRHPAIDPTSPSTGRYRGDAAPPLQQQQRPGHAVPCPAIPSAAVNPPGRSLVCCWPPPVVALLGGCMRIWPGQHGDLSAFRRQEDDCRLCLLDVCWLLLPTSNTDGNPPPPRRASSLLDVARARDACCFRHSLHCLLSVSPTTPTSPAAVRHFLIPSRSSPSPCFLAHQAGRDWNCKLVTGPLHDALTSLSKQARPSRFPWNALAPLEMGGYVLKLEWGGG